MIPQILPLQRTETLRRLTASHAPLLAALLAAAASLPALWLPFLADDWINLAAVADQVPVRTPFGYFRPLYLETYWFDWSIWGLSASGFHFTNLILVSAATAVTVMLIRRYTADHVVVLLAGLLFALHPYHFTNVAWIAARADTLYSLLFVCSALSYDSWRLKRSGLPLLALLLFETALLAKEAAISLPIFLLLVGSFDARRRPDRAEFVRGYVPLIVVAGLHFLLVRPLALGNPGFAPLKGFGLWWVWKFLGFSVAAVLPAPIELLEYQPAIWGAIATVMGGTLLVLARRGQSTLPPIFLPAALSFVILLFPSLISFQDRYLFLPSAASALAIAVLIRSTHGGGGGAAFDRAFNACARVARRASMAMECVQHGGNGERQGRPRIGSG